MSRELWRAPTASHHVDAVVSGPGSRSVSHQALATATPATKLSVLSLPTILLRWLEMLG